MSSEVETSLDIPVLRNSKRLNSFVSRLSRRCPRGANRPCRSSHSLHSSTEFILSEVEGLGMTNGAASRCRFEPDRLPGERKSFVTKICPARAPRQLIHFGK